MKVFIIAAMSADGFIGYDSGHRSLDWRSSADAEFFTRTTKEAGVMVMGSTTYNTFRIKRAPPGRRLIVYTSRPRRVVGEGIETTNQDPKTLVNRMEHEGLKAIAVCGGSIVYKMFLDAGLVDEIYLTIEPVFFGSGVTLFGDEVRARLALLDHRKLGGDTILLHYLVKNRKK